MRNLKIFIIAFLLIIGPVILESCCLGAGSCGCGSHSGGDDPTFSINSMTLVLMPHPETSTTVPTPAVFSAVEFVVQMNFTYAELLGSFGSALFACSPLPPKASDPIAAIEIKSDAVLETTSGDAPAGSNLNFIFGAYYMGIEDRPVEDLIGELYMDRSFYFMSKSVLTKLQTHTFTITITLKSGKTFTMVSPALQVN